MNEHRTGGTEAGADEAAQEAVQPDRLLPGEDEGTPYVEDAHHWVKVYTELLEFKAEIVSLTEERVPSMDPDSGAEVKATDLKVLRAEAARLGRRVAYWRAQAAGLEQSPDRT